MKTGNIILFLLMCSLSSFSSDSENLQIITDKMDKLVIGIGILQIFVLIILGVLLHKSYTDGIK